MKDLNALNETLFDTLEKVKNDEMDTKKAAAIVNVSNAIISSGKLQLQAYKMATSEQAPAITGVVKNGRVRTPKLLSETQAVKPEAEEPQLQDFLKVLGYASSTEAENELGPLTLHNKFETWKANQ